MSQAAGATSTHGAARESSHDVYDVIVLGLGGMGAAAAAHLARRGQRVLGLEQHALGHALGASHGETRLIRRAYFESPRYVPLLERAYQLWDELSAATGEELLHRVGLAMCAPGGGSGAGASGGDGAFARALATAREVGVPVEELTAAQAMARWPSLRLPEDFSCLYEPGAGFLAVERCVLAHLEVARRYGAELRAEEPVHRWRAGQAGDGDGDGASDGVEVTTAQGTYRARALVIAAGPWSAPLLAELALPLRVHRVVQLWFPAGEAMDQERGMPCYAFDVGGHFFYGFPRWGQWGAKFCEHAPGAAVADGALAAVDRALHDDDVTVVAEAVARYLPEAIPRPAHHKVCLYTMTPDEDFLIDLHPRHKNVAIAAGFSGHGFKFASVVGEILADLVVDGGTRHPIDFLRVSRPAIAAPR